MVVQITKYVSGWEIKNNRGFIKLMNKDGRWYPFIFISDKKVFEIVEDLLRNEEPIYHDTNTLSIQTGKEEVGEG